MDTGARRNVRLRNATQSFKRNMVIAATEEMNAQRGEKIVFTFNMEWMDINSTAAIANAVQTDENTFFSGLATNRVER